jgi:putative phage-type endonuclease
MRSDLIITPLKYATPEWYEYRKSGIGGSDIGTVLGLNRYDTVARLFHEKLGTIPPRLETNERMFWGSELEDKIAKIWSYYDGRKDGYIENIRNNKIVRECRRLNGYVVNPKYPWLFASLDRVINIKGGTNLITGEPLKTEGVLECKTLSYWQSQIWMDGIPIYYIAQIQQYMLILDSDYAEIAILQDGNDFKVEKIERDDILCQKIAEISRMFWENRILPAKKAFDNKERAQMQRNLVEVEKWDAEINRYEPEPDQSEAYKEFMEERFLKTREVIEGNMAQYELCKKDTLLRKVNGRIDQERTGIKNILLKSFVDSGNDVLDFGTLGNVTWSERKGAKNRTFSIRIKENPTEEQVEKEFKKIDQNAY